MARNGCKMAIYFVIFVSKQSLHHWHGTGAAATFNSKKSSLTSHGMAALLWICTKVPNILSYTRPKFTPYPIIALNNLSKFLRKYTKLYARLGRLCFACKCNMLHHDVLLQQITLHSSRVIRNSKTILVSNAASAATIRRRAAEPRLARWRRQMGSSTPTLLYPNSFQISKSYNTSFGVH